jgi:preprotein translocase subunit YajC
MSHEILLGSIQPNLLLAQDGPPLSGAAPGSAAGGAETTGAGGAGASTAAGQDMNFIFMMIIPLVLIMLVISTFSQRRERKRRAQMLGGIKKHDRVRTIGGVLGSVVELKPDTVVLKVDESSNIRMTFSRDAIQQVVEVDAS